MKLGLGLIRLLYGCSNSWHRSILHVNLCYRPGRLARAVEVTSASMALSKRDRFFQSLADFFTFQSVIVSTRLSNTKETDNTLQFSVKPSWSHVQVLLSEKSSMAQSSGTSAKICWLLFVLFFCYFWTCYWFCIISCWHVCIIWVESGDNHLSAVKMEKTNFPPQETELLV